MTTIADDLILTGEIECRNRVTLRATGQDITGDGKSHILVQSDGANERKFTIPSSSTDASFVLTETAQTINGAKTFSSGPTFQAIVTTNAGITNTSGDIQVNNGSTSGFVLNNAGSSIKLLTNTANSRNYVIENVGGNGPIQADSVQLLTITTTGQVISLTNTFNIITSVTAGSGIARLPALTSVEIGRKIFVVTTPIPANNFVVETNDAASTIFLIGGSSAVSGITVSATSVNLFIKRSADNWQQITLF